ncbi:MAG: polysaccharide deacetylase family protein [Melioribacteraceae bacterium]
MKINYGSSKGLGEIVLSFDDGPHPINTPKLLNLLKKENIKALFFIVGQNIESGKNFDIVKRAFDEGHVIGNHTYSHKNLKKLSDVEIKSEILRAEELVGNYLTIPKLIRPPYGAADMRVNKIIHELGYFSVLWNIDTLDWKNRSINWVNDAINQVKLREDSIILMHDIHKTTVDNVSNLIAKIRDQEKQFNFIAYV